MTGKRLVQALAASSVLAWLVTGCLRLNPPDHLRCESDGDCDAGDKCAAERCLAMDQCSFSGDCRNGQVCTVGKCVEPECRDGQDAPCSPYICNNNSCATGCYGVGCVSGFRCAEGGKCVAGLAAVGEECERTADCDSAKCCQIKGAQRCAVTCPLTDGAACKAADECASGYCCKSASGATACSAKACPFVECTADANCAAGKKCEAQKCVTRPAPPGVDCELDSDCSSQQCDFGFCSANDETAGPCRVDEDCGQRRTCCDKFSSKPLCSDQFGSCPVKVGGACEVDSECVPDADCGSLFYCTKSCNSDADCGMGPDGMANLCVGSPKTCHPGCVVSSDCPRNDFTALFCEEEGYCDY
jgi:hypothetical protein